MASSDKETSAILFALQADLIAKMQRNVENFAKEPTYSKLRIDRLNTRLATYQAEYDSFQQNHRQLVMSSDAADMKHTYFTEFHIDTFESFYCDAVAAVKEQLGKVTACQTPLVSDSAQNTSIAIDHTTEVEVRLPEIELPTFSGAYTDWPSFSDRFTSSIHKHRHITDAQRLMYLKSAVRGDAATVICGFATTDSNYLPAWNVLKERYENKRIIFTHAMKSISKIETMKTESALELKAMLGITDAAMKSLESIGLDKEMTSVFVAFFLCQKLPLESIMYIEERVDRDEILRYETLKKSMNIRICSLDMITQTKQGLSGNNSARSAKGNNTERKVNSYHFGTKSQQEQNQESSIICKLCSENHITRVCRKFLSMSCHEREAAVERLKLCRNCLSSSHFVAACKSQSNCRECGSRHHTLIHSIARDNKKTSEVNSGNKQISKHIENTGNVTIRSNYNRTINIHSFRQVLLATAIVKVRARNGDYYPLRALLDQGGDGSSITEAAAQRLQLPVLKQRIEIKPFGGGPPMYANKIAELHLKSIYNSSFNIAAPAVVMKTLTDVLPVNYIKIDKWPHIEGLELADPDFFKPSKIDMVLGADVYSCALLEGLRKGRIGTPMAQKTELGWILSGPLITERVIPHTSFQNHVCIGLNELLQKFFEIESVPEVSTKSKDDQYCEGFFNETTTRSDDGRLQVRLPFRTPHDPTAVLGKSKAFALQQFSRLERRFHSNPQFKMNYAKGMEDYISQGHMHLAPDTEEDCIIQLPNSETFYQSYYIPHHAVIKESSTTTKLRNVFNASQKSSNGNSLNDVLYPGPVMLADLTAILLNWRCHRIAFAADIQQMYRQIRIHPSDITYQRILWRSDCNQNIEEYCMNRLTFGTNFAPSFAILGLHHLAKLERSNFPRGAIVIENDTYMDDVISGNATVELALRDQYETTNMLQSAGFPLRKWASNSKELLKAVPLQDREVSVEFSEDNIVKTLGVYWETENDTFSFRISIEDKEPVFTKRAIMSTICKLYDPLGLVSPVIVQAKMIMKDIWRSKCDWDDVVGLELQSRWSKYLSELVLVHDMRVDRWLCFSPNCISVQLHGFADASLQGYGAVIYLRVIDVSNKIFSRLWMSKSKIAPMTPTTIPRLELCAAVMLAKLMEYVTQAVRHLQNKPVEIKLWTDSQTVLQWIRGDANRWQTFVSNRVAAIQKATEVEQWNHVRTHDNPADLISRGVTPKDLKSSNLWWFGPKWLSQTESEWPTQSSIEVEPFEERKIKIISTHVQFHFDFLSRFSSLRKLLRITAWFHRFFAILQKRVQQFKGTLTASELRESELFWVRSVQRHVFASEIELLRIKKPLKGGRLCNLHPFVDQQGILRVGGRLKNSELDFNEKHPIVLPDKHHFTFLLIEAAHHRTLHGGTQLTMSCLRKEYWILNARKTISSKIQRCVICHRQRAKCTEQLMADLPAARVRISKPFSHVGVDFCGPFLTRASKGRGIKSVKSYVAVFVCLCVKAIHLELVSDLSSEAFLSSFRRFISRRGLPSSMYSDCGTNFLGASKIILDRHNEFRKLVNESVVGKLANEGIEWNFNPPASPHFGGLFEAGVKSTKYHLKRVLGNASLTFEEFTTVLTQIEACLNSRPLVPLSSDPDDFTVITPSHFLSGDSLLALPEPSVLTEVVAIGNRYKFMQKLRDDFWAQWSSEYLNRLQNRPKWHHARRNLRINDMVLLRDERLPPTKWALARVIATHPGTDGLVRVVTIKTASGIFKRPVIKLSLLPIEDDPV